MLLAKTMAEITSDVRIGLKLAAAGSTKTLYWEQGNTCVIRGGNPDGKGCVGKRPAERGTFGSKGSRKLTERIGWFGDSSGPKISMS